MQERTQELIDLFNKEEQKRQRLRATKFSRRKWAKKLGRDLQMLLDRLDEKIEKRAPVDCLSKKWVG